MLVVSQHARYQRKAEGAPGEGASLGTLDRLQASLRKRQVDVPQWAREQKPSAGPLAATAEKLGATLKPLISMRVHVSLNSAPAALDPIGAA